MIGGTVRTKRKALRLSQEALAERANLHPTYISEIERGRVNASIFSFYQLAQALNIEFADLLNLPSENIDQPLERELTEIIARIRTMEKQKRMLFITAMKGMLGGIEG